MRSLALCTAVLTALSAALGCASRAEFPEHAARRGPVAAPPAADAGTVAAVVVGKSLTIGDIDADIADQIASARATYEMSLYDARRAALEQRIEREILRVEAERRGMSAEALIAAEIDAKLSAPSEPEMRALYEQFKDQMDGASYEMMSDRLREHMSQERRSARQREYFGELRARHGVKVLLDPPRVAVEARGPARGPASAKVTIVIYSDFECPFCARAEPTLAKIRETWPNDVRFVFRHYPLPFHAAARPAAAAASCAAEQGRFWEVHDRIFSTGELASDAIRAAAGALPDFDLNKYDDCLAQGRGDAVVEADIASAGLVQVDSTPHFFINGVRVSGAQGFEAFQSIIEGELAR